MQELINIIAEKAGITTEQARQSAEATKAYIKTKMPGIAGQQLDAIFNGKTWDQSLKDTANSAGEELRNRLEGLADDLRSALDKAFRK